MVQRKTHVLGHLTWFPKVLVLCAGIRHTQEKKKKNLLSTCSPLITHLLFCTVSTSYNLQVSSHTFLVAVAGLYLFLTLVQSCSMAVVLCFSPDPTLLS